MSDEMKSMREELGLGEVGQAPEDADFPEGPTMSRRSLLGGLGAAVGVLAAGVVPAAITSLPAGSAVAGATEKPEGEALGEDGLEEIRHEGEAVRYPGAPVSYADPPGDQKWGMVIDVKACIGCRRCVYACVEENNISRDGGFTYIKVLEMELGKVDIEHANLDYEEGGRPDKWYLPVQCMHCSKPTCVYGCPVIATWREPDGIVVIDYDKCIACRNCMVTCPYFARHFNWSHPHVPEEEINPEVPLEEKAGVVEKCTFCVQRVRNGQTTACTEACPVGARTFGDLNDPDSAVSQLLKTRRVWRLKEEYGTEPVIWYVG